MAIAGRFKYRLILMKPQVTQTPTGASRLTYVQTKEVWAERLRFTGRRSIEAGEEFADYTAEYNIYIAHQCDDGWRVQEIGGHLYDVVTTDPNRDRGIVTLKCQRVNL